MSTPPSEDATRRYAELCRRVDAFFAEVSQRAGADMACRAGCDLCCKTQLSVTTLEAAVLREGLLAASDELKQRLRARLSSPPAERCLLLGDDGRCQAYDARPLVCRSHGLPLRLRTPRGLEIVSSCELNFQDADVEADMVLDQERLSTILGALDSAFSGAAGRPRGARTPIREVVREALGDGA